MPVGKDSLELFPISVTLARCLLPGFHVELVRRVTSDTWGVTIEPMGYHEDGINSSSNARGSPVSGHHPFSTDIID